MLDYLITRLDAKRTNQLKFKKKVASQEPCISLCSLSSEVLLREVIWQKQFPQLGFHSIRFCPCRWSGWDRFYLCLNLMSESLTIYLDIVEKKTAIVTTLSSEQGCHHLHQVNCAYLQKFIRIGPVYC